ncbi:Helix-turn-helix, Psq-like [Penicillium camemberti]|uniref:Helix-turn-helix, Psq-like n=1 Tax=Penicillium camemberti (strain FM 013) TaxID=1429867 RepID=A0A0G4P9Y3_PENC3|nr:Helix-turn-helix, Psq-like [Penicillium camemberti]
MPPIRSQSSRNPTEQEERISLAIEALKNQETSSIRELARRFDVPCTTLRNRLSGRTQRSATRANSHKLTELEEDTLENWILSMQSRGATLRPSMVREMADLVLQKRGTTSDLSVGQNWATNFLKRRHLLRTRSRSPPSPLDSALNRISKACQTAMQSAALLERAVSDLRTAIEKQERERARSREQIPAEAGLSVQEPSQLITEPVEAMGEHPPSRSRATSPGLRPSVRSPQRCSGCKNTGHKINRCPAR